jgi:flagellar FliL protein
MADQGERGTRGGLLTIILAITGVSLILLIVMGIGTYMIWSSRTESKEAKIIEQKPEPGKIFNLGSFIVNLADEEASRYVNAEVQLEYSKVNKELDAEIKERSPQFQDLVNTLLNDRKAAELSTAEGKERFRRDLQLKINETLKFGTVTNVFLTKFAIQ